MYNRCAECGSWEVECMWDEPVEGCGCNRCLSHTNQLLQKNLEGLENFKALPLEKKLEFLEQIGILEKDGDKYKLSKDYGG
jgi:hypothetical protein